MVIEKQSLSLPEDTTQTPEDTTQTPNEKRALEIAQGLEKENPGWLDVLPDCPCTVKLARNPTTTKWTEQHSPFLQTYHPGAFFEFRSTDTYSSGKDTAHDQQCTYDEQENLITSGHAAGTPDNWAPGSPCLEVFGGIKILMFFLQIILVGKRIINIGYQTKEKTVLQMKNNLDL
ncbi:MAG: hypothetical protein HRO68_09810 [Nitrosopumilus sp.]|nr:hypothetical protein [Nitrosopumilus sp.]